MTQLPAAGRTGARSPESSSNFVRMALKEIGLFAALLYFGGWVYLNRYYSQFDIDVSLLEFDWHDVIVHSAALLKNGAMIIVKSWLGLGILVLPAVLWLGDRYLSHLLRDKWEVVGTMNARFYFPLIGAIAALFIFLMLVQYVGAAQARKDWAAPREPVIISFKDDKCAADPYLRTANDHWQLRLLKATPKWYFVFKPASSQNATKSLPIRVFHVPTSCIGSVRREISPR